MLKKTCVRQNQDWVYTTYIHVELLRLLIPLRSLDFLPVFLPSNHSIGEGFANFFGGLSMRLKTLNLLRALDISGSNHLEFVITACQKHLS